MTDETTLSAPSSTDRAPGFEPGDEGSIPSERADHAAVLFALACAKRERVQYLEGLSHGVGRVERIALLTAEADALDWAISNLSSIAEHGGPHDYYIVATMHHKHYATYEEAKAALAKVKAELGASTNGKKRQRGATQRIYRCHSFGRSCKEPPGDGAKPVEANA